MRGRRFRPTLWPTLGLLLLLGTTLTLGNWQRHRAIEKQALRDQYDVASRETAIAVTGALIDAAALRFRPVHARGEYDASRQMLIDNKVLAGRVGFDVVTPLKLADGAYVLIDRGWVAQGARRADLPSVPPPAGDVDVEGRINFPPLRYLELGGQTGHGPVVENLDLKRAAAETGLPLLPFLVEQTGATGDRLAREWPAPDFGIEQHRSYMIQWFCFAALGVILWLSLNWRKVDE